MTDSKEAYILATRDYSGNVITVLKQIINRNTDVIPIIDEYLNEQYPDENVTYISTKPSAQKITFSPNVFDVPTISQEDDLIAVMMPFSAEFSAVSKAIQESCKNSGFRCLRADDIWEESTIMQDIFNLIFRAKSIIVDFSGKNPNVMYETGIAHTLGKTVIPITQNISDIPSDMKHHRALSYLLNTEGLGKLSSHLTAKLRSISA